MNLRMCSAIVVAIGSLAVTASSVQALPTSRTIQYSIHADPADPQSDIVLTVDLVLVAVNSNSTAVAWDIKFVDLTQPDLGSGETAWRDASPSVGTSDGLWWIKHADLENPTTSEFVLPPLVDGTAVEQNVSNPDLADYAIEGTLYVPPAAPEEPPFGTTGAVNDLFWIVGEAQSLVDILDQPVCIIDPEEEDAPCGDEP